jgi:hypothetical protein
MTGDCNYPLTRYLDNMSWNCPAKYSKSVLGIVLGVLANFSTSARRPCQVKVQYVRDMGARSRVQQVYSGIS